MELLNTLREVLIYLLESATCLAIFYVFYHFFLRKERCFQYNRFYLVAAILFSVVFPLMNVSYNAETTPTLLNTIHEVSNEPIIVAKKGWNYTITAESQKPFFLWWEALTFIYALGVIGLSLRFFIQMRTVRDFIWYQRHVTRYRENYYLVNTQGLLPTFSFFNFLFWDDSQKLTPSERKQILEHEKVHIRQRHSFDILAMEILKVIFWFNPFMYLYKNLFEEVHEYEADRKVVRQNDQQEYTKLLVRLVFSKMGFQHGSHFAKSATLKRVNMIMGNKSINPLRLMAPLPIAAMLFFIFSCEAVYTSKDVDITSIEYTSSSFGASDVKPLPVEGLQQWSGFLKKEIKYPSSLQKKEGDVVVSFVVTKSGDVRAIKVVESLGEEYDNQVIEALKNSPKWQPGIKSGRTINTRIKVPIHFKHS